MIIYPAIDIKNGKCVRLYQVIMIRNHLSGKSFCPGKSFIDQGASWLHLVDLDGAKNPDQSQAVLMADLIRDSNINIQIGGGIRKAQQVEALLKQGAKRVIIGSNGHCSSGRSHAMDLSFWCCATGIFLRYPV